MRINCIIVDDEKMARQGLSLMLDKRPDIRIQKSCENGMEAIEAISQLKPDLVLLDVQMPGINGFEVLASLLDPRPLIIFITAHDQYAIKAFEVSAIDYILKPFSDERFYRAIDKAVKTITNRELIKSNALDRLVGQTKDSLKGPSKIISQANNDAKLVIKADGKVNMVPLESISHIEAYDYYIKIHVADKFFLIRESMKKISERIPPELFIRIHKSYIVNTKMIEQIGNSKDGTYQVSLSSGHELKISRSYKSSLHNFIK